MSRLNDLYKAMETLRNEGVSGDALVHKMTEREEEIIKEEILPLVTKAVAPALNQVQRELTLVIDYMPGEPIKATLSRKTRISEMIDSKAARASKRTNTTVSRNTSQKITQLGGYKKVLDSVGPHNSLSKAIREIKKYWNKGLKEVLAKFGILTPSELNPYRLKKIVPNNIFVDKDGNEVIGIWGNQRMKDAAGNYILDSNGKYKTEPVLRQCKAWTVHKILLLLSQNENQ
ncbi:MAG: hypothetical protein IJT90_04540 [Bacteroidaceae bacterium]|nr:hypothetical protein [Bacteroidaceae bacterium]